MPSVLLAPKFPCSREFHSFGTKASFLSDIPSTRGTCHERRRRTHLLLRGPVSLNHGHFRHDKRQDLVPSPTISSGKGRAEGCRTVDSVPAFIQLPFDLPAVFVVRTVVEEFAAV